MGRHNAPESSPSAPDALTRVLQFDAPSPSGSMTLAPTTSSSSTSTPIAAPAIPPAIPPALSELDTTAELRAVAAVEAEVASAVELATCITEDGPLDSVTTAELRAISASDFIAARYATCPPPRRTRAAERAYRRRPAWRRSPAIPAVAAALAVLGVADAIHLVALNGSAGARTKSASAAVDLSALLPAGSPRNGQQSTSAQSATGTGSTATGNSDSDSDPTLSTAAQRVSRSKRTLRTSSPDASALPARPTLPKIQPGKTVLGTWVRPSAGGESSCFCMRWGVMHDGVDLAGPLGSAIVAVGDGVVVAAGPAQGFGHWIVIQHSNGDVSVYGHMYTVDVSVGEHVKAGQHIADIGADGQSTGPHLHFGIKVGLAPGASEAQVLNGGKYIDPVPWLKARGIDVGPYNPNA
ncbi:M23 family metallopeptidase [Jatrophihabitans telluris]|uniref:M23 family metallopeptidase n=1 Tax=Jatrophihabitans telluris TaxID=2038343 RepID=A0ABY4QYC7_9ACTN|nr:M23 family metallopeptidase [Jatrophihabitans telluris]UQX87856.1 M23 family metallopeptidase [Jatrophihabitans telluris]